MEIVVSRLQDDILSGLRHGNAAKAVRLAQDHLAAARRNTLAFGADKTIEAKVMPDTGPVLDSRSRYNGRPPGRKESGT